MSRGAGRPAKRAKDEASADPVRSLLHKSSKHGLFKILQALKASPDILDDITEIQQLTVAETQFRDSVLEKRTYTKECGGTFELPFACPCLAIPQMVDKCPQLSRRWERALLTYPPSLADWRLVIAFDEFSPGNPLAPLNRRKTMVCSLTFLELQPLHNDAIWFTPLVIRGLIYKSIDGGWARVFSDFLEHLMLGPSGLATAGMALRVAGQHYLVRAKIHAILSDGEGLQRAFNWKGASSLKPCMLCWNIWSRCDIADRGDGHEEISCHQPALFKRTGTRGMHKAADSLVAAWRRRSRGEATKKFCEDLEKVCGFTANANGVLSRTSLRQLLDVSKVVTYDWMHNLLAGGTFTQEVELFLHAAGVKSRSIQDFLSDKKWRWPAWTAGSPASMSNIFAAGREGGAAGRKGRTSSNIDYDTKKPQRTKHIAN